LLSDKTVKRHLPALSQFFQFAVDRQHLTVATRSELVEDHSFREDRGVRDQRDACTPEELVKLFASPVWTGCLSTHRRSQSGQEIIRDAKFWLSILALYRGARLEEFADLYLLRESRVRSPAGTAAGRSGSARARPAAVRPWRTARSPHRVRASGSRAAAPA
jgi:hypothetical protein